MGLSGQVVGKDVRLCSGSLEFVMCILLGNFVSIYSLPSHTYTHTHIQLSRNRKDLLFIPGIMCVRVL